jgi:hypothetical protein
MVSVCRRGRFIKRSTILNVALFDCTAKDWREANKAHSKKGLNIRDFASINELVVLFNLENLNALMIGQQIEKSDRFKQLKIIGKSQLETLEGKGFIRSIKRLSDKTYLDIKKKDI